MPYVFIARQGAFFYASSGWERHRRIGIRVSVPHNAGGNNYPLPGGNPRSGQHNTFLWHQWVGMKTRRRSSALRNHASLLSNHGKHR